MLWAPSVQTVEMDTFSAKQSAKGTGIWDFVSPLRMIAYVTSIEHENSTPANAWSNGAGRYG
jgi:hypothetical protein